MQGDLLGGSGLPVVNEAQAQGRDNLIETILSTEFDPKSLDGVKKE